MFPHDELTVEISEADRDVVQVEISTPFGVIKILGNVRFVGRILYVVGAHIQGLSPGVLGRAGLNAIGWRLLEAADVDQIVIEGSTRTTGAMVGRAPRTITFPHP